MAARVAENWAPAAALALACFQQESRSNGGWPPAHGPAGGALLSGGKLTAFPFHAGFLEELIGTYASHGFAPCWLCQQPDARMHKTP